jgi:hypothetical protein
MTLVVSQRTEVSIHEWPRTLILGNPEGIKRAGAELDPGPLALS